eukprot:s2260_g10.t1
MPSPPQTTPDVEIEDIQLDPKTLAGMLDNDPFVRARLRYKEQGKLLRWPVVNGVEMAGQIAMPTIALNVRALKILAKFWCPKTKEDPLVNEFYDELFRHWRPRVPGPVPLVNLEEDDEEEGEVDLNDFFQVKGEKVEDVEGVEGVEDPPMEMDPYYTLSLWTEDDQQGESGKGELEGDDEPGKGELLEAGVAEGKVGGDEPGKGEGKVEVDEPKDEVVEGKLEGAVSEVGEKLETSNPGGPLVSEPPCQPPLKPSFAPEKMSSSDLEARIAKVKHLVSRF